MLQPWLGMVLNYNHDGEVGDIESHKSVLFIPGIMISISTRRCISSLPAATNFLTRVRMCLSNLWQDSTIC